MFAIDEDIELPKFRRQATKYPFDDMAVGHSFLVTDDDSGAPQRVYQQVSIRNAKDDRRYTCRKVVGGIRVWRTE